MKKEFQILAQCPLFAGIDEKDLPAMMECLSVEQKQYGKDEYIFVAQEDVSMVGVVLSGHVHVLQEDYWGNRNILTTILPGGIFGEAFSCAGVEKLPVSVAAMENSEVLLMDYAKIIRGCPNTCVFHAQLIENMVRVLAQKNILLTQKMEVLSRRTTREKLLAYLSGQAIGQGSSAITIPFDRQELADYLLVDRSAMSAELGKMRDEGLITFHKNRFTLLD